MTRAKWHYVDEDGNPIDLDQEIDMFGRFTPHAIKNGEDYVVFGGSCQWTGSLVFGKTEYAKTILAAPELLEACIKARLAIGGIDPDDQSDWPLLAGMLDAAIAKAKGEKS